MKCKPLPKDPNSYSTNRKQPRKISSNDMEHKLVWQFKHLDMDHEKWGWKNLKGSVAKEILEKLTSYELRTVNEIRQDSHRDHAVAVKNLLSKANERLKELNLDDIDELYRLRFNGCQRLWGILDRYIFKIIWWDPKHEICPSSKKHT